MITEKEVLESLGLKTAGLPDEQKQFINLIVSGITEVINKSNEGAITEADLTKRLQDLNRTIKSSDVEGLDELKKDNEDLIKQVKNLAGALEKLQKKGVGISFVEKFDETFNAMYDSPKFQDFINGKEKSVNGFSFKDISLTDNFTSTNRVTLTGDTGKVVSRATDRRTHIRDYATIIPCDPEHPIAAWQEIYDLDRNARYVSENGSLPESSFKIREHTSEVKRAGHYFKMSKRMLKSRVYVRSFILNKIVSGVLMAEDFGILYGDGTGDNLKGITTYEGVLPVEKIISDSIITGAAGEVESVKNVENGILVTFTKPYDLLVEGLKITFAGATTNTVLNDTFDVIKANDKQILLEGITLTDTADAATTDAAALTFKVNNGAFKSIESPNSIDALETAVAVMTYAQFTPSVIVLNPITMNSILAEKATDGNRLDILRDINTGAPVIGGLPVKISTLIPAGKYFLGDFNEGANIYDYTPLTVEWADDVETKLKNQIVLIAQEELIVPVFCPWAFSYGSLSALKTAIKAD